MKTPPHKPTDAQALSLNESMPASVPVAVPVAAPVAAPVPAPHVNTLISFLEHDAQPMIVLDPDYNILAANTAYQQQFGSRGQSFVGRKCFQVSHHYDVPCDQAGEHCPMRQARQSKAPDRVLHVHHTPRGPEHVDVELRPILDEQRQVVAYVERLITVRQASAVPSAEGLVGKSPAFVAALAAVQRVAPSMLPVLLLGESGTGKELFARAVHEASDRAHGPFVVVDCSGLTETLFESELFGYERGAFTGATARKPGLVETANGGTLFLDEMGDVPLAMQVKLLRLIENGTFRRVGGTSTLQSNFRLVAATHQPLHTMIHEGRFRQDLYYRISAFPIELPPLRERVQDIPILIDSMLQRGNPNQRTITVDADAMTQLQAYAWPGNIRQLRNVLERARLFADDGIVRPAHLPAHLSAHTSAHTSAAPQHGVQPAPHQGGTTPAVDAAHLFDAGTASTRSETQDALLRQLVSEKRLSRRDIAAQLGLSERTLYRRLKKLGLA